MAELTITSPAYVRIANKSNARMRFQPYKENFTTLLEPQTSLAFSVKYPGTVLYYLQQATHGLDVEHSATAYEVAGEGDTFDAEGKATEVFSLPAKITITNTSSKNEIGFIPYKESTAYYVKPGDSIDFTATTAGQVLYYLAQHTATADRDGLVVTQEAIVAPADDDEE